MDQPDKNVLLTPKISITPKDIEEIPALKDLKDAIDIMKEQEAKATGKKKYKLKKWLIEMYQEQYTIKSLAKQTVFTSNVVKSFAHSSFPDKIYIDDNKMPHNDGLVSFFNPKHISALLCNYSMLKQES